MGIVREPGVQDRPEAVEARKAIPTWLDEVNNSLFHLQELLSELELRLTLDQSNPAEKNKERETISSDTPMVCTLQGFHRRIESMHTQTEDILTRLEL